MSWRSTVIGLVVSAAATFLALRQVRLADAAGALLGAQPALLAGGAALLPLAIAARAWRWRQLFGPAHRVTFGGAISATYIGYLLNTVLPGRTGEIARAYLVSASDRVEAGRALGTIFLEKLLDVFVLVVFLGAVALLMPLPEWAAGGAMAVVAVAAVAALAFLTLARARQATVQWLVASVERVPVLRRLPIARFAGAALDTAGAVSPRRLVWPLASSVLVWGLSAGAVYAVMGAFRLPVPAAAAVLVLAVTNLGLTVPAAPAGFGVYHLLAIEALQLFGVPRGAALSYAVTMHLITYGTFVAGGLICLWRRCAFVRTTVTSVPV